MHACVPKEEQVLMIMKNLLIVYHKHLLAGYYPYFRAFNNAGTQIDDVNNVIAIITLKNEEALKNNFFKDTRFVTHFITTYTFVNL